MWENKQSDTACIIWDKIPLNLKELSVYQFSKKTETLFTVRTT